MTKLDTFMCSILNVRASLIHLITVFSFLLVTPGQPDIVHFKVGRTIAMNRRLAEHNNKCRSSRPALLNFYPTPETNEPTPGASDESTGELATNANPSQPNLTLSMIQPGEKSLYSHMLERLVHLELSDIAANSHPALGIISGGRTGVQMPRRPCADCK